MEASMHCLRKLAEWEWEAVGVVVRTEAREEPAKRSSAGAGEGGLEVSSMVREAGAT